MGGHGPGALAEPAGLHDHDRLRTGECRAALMNLRASVSPSMYIRMLRVSGIPSKVIDEKSPKSTLDHRPDGYKGGEPHVLMDGGVQDRGPQRAALREEGYGSGLREFR